MTSPLPYHTYEVKVGVLSRLCIAHSIFHAAVAVLDTNWKGWTKTAVEVTRYYSKKPFRFVCSVEGDEIVFSFEDEK